jgi:hypothetical protein
LIKLHGLNDCPPEPSGREILEEKFGPSVFVDVEVPNGVLESASSVSNRQGFVATSNHLR